MSRRAHRFLILVGLGALLPQQSTSAGKKDRRRPEYPLNCAGIVAGISTDRDVVRMYGPGLFAPAEGHGGGRYYVDAKRSVTLHVETGVDSYIESVSYGKGVRLPAALRKEVVKAVSTSLAATEFSGAGLRIGESALSILRQFGKPKSDHRAGRMRILRYESDYHQMPYVLVYESRWEFVDDRLTDVQLYNGE